MQFFFVVAGVDASKIFCFYNWGYNYILVAGGFATKMLLLQVQLDSYLNKHTYDDIFQQLMRYIL
jgi:hypothetical protein